MKAGSRKKEIRSFLVMNPFGIGDVLFSTPLLRSIRANFPDARIYYLCSKRSAPILRIHPLVEKVFIYDRDEFAAEMKKSFFAGLLKYWRFILRLRRERIGCALDLSLNTLYGFFAWMAGIKKRYGLDYKKRAFFLNGKVRIQGFNDKHVADYYLDVLRLLDVPAGKYGLEVYTGGESDAWAENFLKGKGITPEKTVIGVAPCGGEAFGRDNHLKRWPPENFSRLIDELAEKYGALIFIFAGPKEKEEVAGITAPLKHRGKVFDFSEISLENTVSLARRCGLFISNDTGLLRFADGLGKKIVALYGPIDEKVYGPYLAEGRSVVVKKDLPCRPCYRNFRLKPCDRGRECLKSISVEEVLEAVSSIVK